MSFFFFSSRRRHTRLQGDWSSDVCSSDLPSARRLVHARLHPVRDRVVSLLHAPAGGATGKCAVRGEKFVAAVSNAFCLTRKSLLCGPGLCLQRQPCVPPRVKSAPERPDVLISALLEF